MTFTYLKWCGYAFHLFERQLKNLHYYPSTAPKIPKNRLFAQFHSPQEAEMKSLILDEIVKSQPLCHIVFATSALGMGVDTPSVHHVIHVGPPRTLEAYFQETGRASRDCSPSQTLLFYNNTDIQASKKEMNDSIREYCKSENLCLRQQLLSHFGFSIPEVQVLHYCCDVCKPQCKCNACTTTGAGEATSENQVPNEENGKQLARKIEDFGRKKLKENLLMYRLSIGSSNRIRVGGIDTTTGFTIELINKIVNDCEYVTDLNYLLSNFDFWSKKHASAVLELIEAHTTLL